PSSPITSCGTCARWWTIPTRSTSPRRTARIEDAAGRMQRYKLYQSGRRSLRRLLTVPEPLTELVEQGLGRLRDHGAGRKDRLGAGALKVFIILRPPPAPDNDQDIVASFLDERGLELWNEREVRRRQRGHAEHMNVVLN